MIVTGNASNTRKIKNAAGTTILTNGLLGANNQSVVLVKVSGETYTPVSFCSVQGTGVVAKSAMSTNDDCYVFGVYSTSPNNRLFDFPENTTPSFIMSTSASNDSYIAKYSSTGVAQWYVRILSSTSDVLNGFAVEKNGDCYACGLSQKGTTGTPLLAYNADEISFTTLETETIGAQNLWAVHYNASGVLQGFALITTTGNEQAFSMAVDDDNGAVYIGGYFNPVSQFIRDFNGNNIDISTLSLTLPAGSGQDAFVLKLNKSGVVSNTQWMVQIGGMVGGAVTSTTEQTNYLHVPPDPYNEVYAVVVGRNGMVVYSEGSTVFANVNPVSGTTNYLLALVQYTKNGFTQWVAGFDAGAGAQINGRVTTTTQGVYLLVYSVVNSSINLVKNDSGIIDSNVIPLTMTNTSGAFAVLIKYSFFGLYAWHMLFNATTAGTSQINDIRTLDNQVYVDLRYAGTFSCNGVSPIGSSTSSGSVLLKINDVGLEATATLCSFSDINA